MEVSQWMCGIGYFSLKIVIAVVFLIIFHSQESTGDHSSEYWHVQKLLKHVRVSAQ